MTFTPHNREESLWANIVYGQNNDIGDPDKRKETLLNAIWKSLGVGFSADKRIEHLLLCILNNEDTDLEPHNRIETLLVDKIKGRITDIVPQSRIEHLLVDWTWVNPSFNNWKDVQKVVRAGRAEEYFNIGDQFDTPIGKWDIIGFDMETPVDTTKTHSMTLQTHDVIENWTFDAREALFAFPNGLESGTYHFTITADAWVSGDVGKTLQFTTTKDIPSGGQLCFSSAYNATMVGSAVQIYASPNDTTAWEETTFTEGSDGTDLGNVNNAISGNTNSLQRTKLGNNRYSQSAVRQILNSSASPFGWTAQNPWDRPSNATVDGFLGRLDADFLAVLGESVQTTALNTACDGGGSEQTHDKVFLVSRSQVFNILENNIDEGSQYPYYAIEANRIKYRNSTAQYWWLRSPLSSYAVLERSVVTGGTLGSSSAFTSYGLAPACTII